MEALAAAAISIVAPYLTKGAEAFAQDAGKQAVGAVKALADRLRIWWSGDPVAKAAAENLAADPRQYAIILGDRLSSVLTGDELFATELRTLVESVGPHIEVVQRIEVAKGVTGADVDELVRGSVHVEQHITEAHDVTGIRARRIGG